MDSNRFLSKLGISALLLILGLFLAGCNYFGKQIPDSGTDKPKPDKVQGQGGVKKPVKTVSDYFPHAEGNSWQYLGEGNEYASYTSKVLYTKGNRFQTSESNGGTVSSIVFEVTTDAITRVFSQGEAYDETNFLGKEPNQSNIILKGPLQVGTKWGETEGQKEIVDINSTIDTPAGKFEKCIKVKINNPDSTLYEYYKDGVGLVKKEFISGDTVVTSTLEKFVIK